MHESSPRPRSPYVARDPSIARFTARCIAVLALVGALASFASAAGGPRRAILLTGYWPPSNEAVRRFSPSPTQNPLGWIGSNWESRGYDVVSYFPEFSPPTCTSCGRGSGDLEVDYQDTSADFWAIVAAVKPIAIVTFSRTNASLSWEVEMNQYNNDVWTNDYVAPLQPTPTPPDASVPADFLRLTTLPAQDIVDDVTAANLGLNAFICFSQSAGAFLSGFMAYHGVWYQSLHASPLDPDWCIAAGHVHVGSGVAWPTAEAAVGVTLRTLIRHVDEVRGIPGPAFCFGDGVDTSHTTACPCGNVGAAGRGCANSAQPAGALLSGAGSPEPDSVVLACSELTGSACIFLQGDALGDVVFGDGVACTGGSLIRLRAQAVTNGASSFPLPGDPSVSTRGQVVPGSGARRYYQTYYRNAAAGFCPPATFNVTNGVVIDW
ncbi:MAG: hypothetical protein IPJ77_04390 [Planctomycetes bacterium]|nr:hypothetical protein [Planctomycetota bacterium]